jgi:hypothetical protein
MPPPRNGVPVRPAKLASLAVAEQAAEHLADRQHCRLQAEADDLGEWIIRSARSGCGTVATRSRVPSTEKKAWIAGQSPGHGDRRSCRDREKRPTPLNQKAVGQARPWRLSEACVCV